MEKAKLHTHRKSYDLKTLNIENVDKNPFAQFQFWFNEAASHSLSEANAMSLATADNQGNVSVRMVLLKEFSEEGFVFFTNYNSRKGRQLKENPNAALLFYWPELQREVRIEGKIKKVPAKISDEYFNSRPLESQIAAIVSEQSSVIPDRKFLDNLYHEKAKLFEGQSLKRPESWGGYILVAKMIEFWQGRTNRLHDRFVYTFQKKAWTIERLAP